jgi:O-methyltransferase involved in polyketide biosynthesis
MKALPRDLSVTALYTAAAWSWGRLPDAELFDNADSRRVFGAVNMVLAAAWPFVGRGAPLKVALLHRHAAIDVLLRASGIRRVLELAAGLSRRGITFSADPGIEYFEVDRPAVIAHKRALLERTEAGRSALRRPNHHLLAGDVTEVGLDTFCPAASTPLFVIAEGLMMYLEREGQQAIFQQVAARLADCGGSFVFDFVPPRERPRPGAVGAALNWLMKRFTSGQSFAQDARTREEVVQDLLACSFGQVEWIEPHRIARAWNLPYPEVPTQQLLFVARMSRSDERGKS